MVYEAEARKARLADFEVASTEALWYSFPQLVNRIRAILKLPPPRHYGIAGGSAANGRALF